MYHLAFLGSVLVTALAVDSGFDSRWHQFKLTHAKVYPRPHVELIRREIWESNMRYIQAHNQETLAGQHSYTLAMNKYGDLSRSEFLASLYGYRSNAKDRIMCPKYRPTVNLKDLPDHVDWRVDGYVSDVRVQANCSSCWAFAAVGALEGQNFMKTGRRTALSVKNLLDCSGPQGNNGCDGGWMSNAFQYVIENKGLATEQSYPYKPMEGECEFKHENVGATASDCRDIESGSEEALQAAVATVGPVAVALEASLFQFYKGGIMDIPACSPLDINHAVLVVGYGTQHGKQYWLIKNSWGPDWGEDGYIRLVRNKNNQCGIASAASFVIA